MRTSYAGPRVIGIKGAKGANSATSETGTLGALRGAAQHARHSHRGPSPAPLRGTALGSERLRDPAERQALVAKLDDPRDGGGFNLDGRDEPAPVGVNLIEPTPPKPFCP